MCLPFLYISIFLFSHIDQFDFLLQLFQIYKHIFHLYISHMIFIIYI